MDHDMTVQAVRGVVEQLYAAADPADTVPLLTGTVPLPAAGGGGGGANAQGGARAVGDGAFAVA